MHLLKAQPGVVADGSEAVDLGQTPGDIVVLSAAGTEFASTTCRCFGSDVWPSIGPRKAEDSEVNCCWRRVSGPWPCRRKSEAQRSPSTQRMSMPRAGTNDSAP